MKNVKKILACATASLYSIPVILVEEAGHYIVDKLAGGSPKIIDHFIASVSNYTPSVIMAGPIATYCVGALCASAAKMNRLKKQFFLRMSLKLASMALCLYPLMYSVQGFFTNTGDFAALARFANSPLPFEITLPMTLGASSLLLYYNFKKK
jgi:hypothetical protein